MFYFTSMSLGLLRQTNHPALSLYSADILQTTPHGATRRAVRLRGTLTDYKFLQLTQGIPIVFVLSIEFFTNTK